MLRKYGHKFRSGLAGGLVAITAFSLLLMSAPAQSAEAQGAVATSTRDARVGLQGPPHALSEFPFALTVRVKGVSPRGKTVRLQERRGGRWRTLGTSRVRARKHTVSVDPRGAALGYHTFRVVLRSRSGVLLDRSPKRRVHVHELGNFAFPSSPTGSPRTREMMSQETPNGQPPPVSGLRGHTFVNLPADLTGSLRCIPGAVQVEDGPLYVNTTGFAYWVAHSFYYGVDGQWYQGPVMASQYNAMVNELGYALVGWRSYATNEYSGSAQIATAPGTWWAVYNIAYDVTGHPVAGGWSFLNQSSQAAAYCQS